MAPQSATCVGLFQIATEAFTWPHCGSIIGSYKFDGAAVAPNGLVVFAVLCNCVGTFNVTDSTFDCTDVTLDSTTT